MSQTYFLKLLAGIHDGTYNHGGLVVKVTYPPDYLPFLEVAPAPYHRIVSVFRPDGIALVSMEVLEDRSNKEPQTIHGYLITKIIVNATFLTTPLPDMSDPYIAMDELLKSLHIGRFFRRRSRNIISATHKDEVVVSDCFRIDIIYFNDGHPPICHIRCGLDWQMESLNVA